MASATDNSFAQLSNDSGLWSIDSKVDLQSFSTEGTVMASQDSIQSTSSSVVFPSFVMNLEGIESWSEDVYSSFTDLTDASQFPMQHATQRSSLEVSPTISAVIGTTDFSTIKVPDNGGASKPLSDQPTLSSSSEEHQITLASHFLQVSSQASDISSSFMPSSSDLIEQATVDMAVLDLNEGTVYDSSLNENREKMHTKTNIDMTPSLPTGLSDKVLYSSTSDYPSVKLGVNLGTLTPSKTQVLIAGVNTDTSGPPLYSTPALPFPLPSDPPKVPTSSEPGSSSVFGEGGPMNIVLFVGVPVCGLIFLILLVALIVCLRKRKANKKSPGRAYNQDLWLNTQMEAPLNPTNPSLGNQNKIPVMKKMRQKVGMRKVKVDQLYEVICDFPGGEDSQLRLRKGEMVKVETREENGWWRGSVGEAAGWFPGSYVEHVQQNSDKISHEEEVQRFLLSDDEEGQERQVSSFMLKKKREQSGGFTGEIQSDLVKEPIYSKIDKNKIHKVSVPKIPEKPPSKHPAIILGESSSTPLADGCKFRAVYSYSPQFKGEIGLVKGELIKGIEKDRNGWMRGIKETGEDGWFPAVYVDEIKEALEEKDTVSQIYKALDINKSALRGQDLVGIPHQVLYNFTAEKPGDLSLKAGDTVAVVQTLENGWFLGCKGQNVGWFPKTFVQMTDQYKEITKDSKPEKEQPVYPVSLNVTEKLDVPNTKEGIMTSRKAPVPPTSLSKNPVSPTASKIPKFAQKPSRPAPTPPVSTGGKETQLVSCSKENADGKMLGPDKSSTEGSFQENHSKQELNDEHYQQGKARPPEIPKRFVKLNLVKIPHTNALSSLAKESPSRPPPPPRPCPPKLGTPKSSAICLREDTASASEDEHYFSLKAHRKFDIGIPKPPSQEEVEKENSKTHLSTFGKVEGEVTPESSKHAGLLSSPEKKIESFEVKGPSTRCIPKLTKQKSVDEAESPTSSLNGYPVKDVTAYNGNICNNEVEASNECVDVLNSANLTFDKVKISELDLSDDERVNATVKDLPSKLPQFKKSIAKPVSGDINSEKDSEPLLNDSGFEDKSETNAGPVLNGADIVPLKAKFRDMNGNEDSVSDIDTDVSCQEPVQYQNDFPLGASKPKPKVASKPKPKVLPKPKVYGSHNRQEELSTMVHTENSPSSATSGSDSVTNEQEKTKMPVFRSSPVLASDSTESSDLDHSLTVDGFPSQENSVRNENNLCEKQDSCISKTDDSLSAESLNDHADKPVAEDRADKQQKTLNSLRQRSNSPHGRTSIPTPKSRQRSGNSDSKDSPGSNLRTRSSSPNSRSGIPALISRQVSESPNAKKKIGSSIPGPRSQSPAMTKSTRSLKNVSGGNSMKDPLKEEDRSDAAIENNKPVSKLQKPSKISKGGDGSQSSKAPKQGKSLLPMIQKSLSSDQGSGVKVKSPSGIPVSRPPRPPPPKSPKLVEEKSGIEPSTVKQAVKCHQAHSEEELSFEVGSIITEISGCDRAGWCVGMLEDGTTGLYPISHVKTAENQTEV